MGPTVSDSDREGRSSRLKAKRAAGRQKPRKIASVSRPNFHFFKCSHGFVKLQLKSAFMLNSQEVQSLEVFENQVADSDLPLSLYSDKIAAISLLEGVSLFELMGVTWMMALTYENWSAETHTHAYDEVRHTKMIQDCARAARWTLSDEDLVKETKLSRAFYQETELYLQKLAKRVFRLTFHQRTCDSVFAISSYALLAFLIERRIMRIYPNLAKFGATEEMRSLAKEIVRDEREHLTLVTGKLPEGLDFAESSQDKIILMEKQLAAEWIANLKAAYGRILG